MDMALSSMPMFSGVGRADVTNGVVAGQILHRYPHFLTKMIRKRKFVKSGQSSVVLCTHYPPDILIQNRLAAGSSIHGVKVSSILDEQQTI